MMSGAQVPFSRPIDVSQVREPRQVRLTANANECRAVASHLGLEAVAALGALIDIRPWRRHGLAVKGELTATVGQICTLTAEPMQTDIVEAFDDRLYPEDRDRSRRPEAVIDIEATDDYETFSGDTVDLGALVVEYLALAIDPYPKSPGAVLGGGEGGEDETPGGASRGDDRREAKTAPVNSPFAGLAEHFAARPDAGADKDSGRTAGGPDKADEGK